jgi:hypothetical protein
LKKGGKVTDIKYKQMDKDEDIRKTTNGMERFILGDKGVGLLEHLGLMPGKIQKHLDEEWDKAFEELLEEHKDHIFWEARRRSADMVQKWRQEMDDSRTVFTAGDMMKVLHDSLKEAEIEVVKELVDHYL